MKKNFVYLIIFFIFVITIYNIFYKPSLYKLFNGNKKLSNIIDLPDVLDSDGKLFCSINGYKCQNERCDCKSICKGEYNKFIIYPNENVVMFNEKLSPGTYCLPKGFEHCNVQTSIPVYSVNAWMCISKNPAIWNKNSFIACQNPYAEDNSLNVLMDTKNNTPVTNQIIQNFYEIHNGKMRYKCVCNSLDKNGNKLIHLDDLPFKCVSDYCLSKLQYKRGIPGWNHITKECDCGHLMHENPNDLTSPCVEEIFTLHNNTFSGAINCMTLNSLQEYPIYCHQNNLSGQIQYKKIFNFSDNPIDYLKAVI